MELDSGSLDQDSPEAVGSNVSTSQRYISRTWVVHAALSAIRPEDYVALSPYPKEVVVGTLAIAGTLPEVFSRKELADAGYNPITFLPLTTDQVERVLMTGVRGGLLKKLDVPGAYAVADEALRQPLVGLLELLDNVYAYPQAESPV